MGVNTVNRIAGIPASAAAAGVSVEEIITGSWNPSGTDWRVWWNDFTGPQPVASGNYALGDGTLGLTPTKTGTSSSWTQLPSASIQADRVGIHDLGLGTSSGALVGAETSSADSTLRYGDSRIKIGAAVKIVDLPSATENITFWMGLGNNINGFANLGTAWYLNYASNNTNWLCQNDGTGLNTQDSGLAFDTDWINLEIDIAEDLSSVKFYANGTLYHTETTAANIPPAGTAVSFNVSSRAGAVTQVNHFYLDWMYLAVKPGTARGSIAPWMD